ncbi:MAG: TetR/AcrR family transcriptional regulator [Micrococcales bacterium]|nr:TetR/AcrR family transcriptional regulator [Micrococcales bacterium]
MIASTPTRDDVRARIIGTAARLLRQEGITAVTTRAVSDAARVQAPTIYRHFGDKDGLLDAVAEHVLATFVAAKAAVVGTADQRGADPIDDLRAGWRTQIEFALDNPVIFGLMVDPERSSPAGRAGMEVLRARMRRVASVGRLRMTPDAAADLLHSAGVGVILTLLRTPPAARDLGLADIMYDAVTGRILIEAPDPPGDDAAADREHLRAAARRMPFLSASERALLEEWLARDAATPAMSPAPATLGK